MTQVLLTLQAMNVHWKTIGHYNIKCRWFHVFHKAEGMNNHHSPDSNYITAESAIIHDDFRAQSIVKFEMQVFLYAICFFYAIFLYLLRETLLALLAFAS